MHEHEHDHDHAHHCHPHSHEHTGDKPMSPEEVLALLNRMPEGRDAALIGRVTAGEGRVAMTTRIGGDRLLEPLTGLPLPRIC